MPPPLLPLRGKTGAYCHGDPHCRTFDGLSYDCHGDGDFLLLDSADAGAVVHAQFEPLVSPDASFTTGVAATEDGSSLIEVTVADGERTILIDGEAYAGGDFPATMTGVTLTVTDQTVGMVFPSGLAVNAARWWTDPNYIGGVYVYAPIAMSTVGVLGTNNGDRTDDWTVRRRGQLSTTGRGLQPYQSCTTFRAAFIVIAGLVCQDVAASTSLSLNPNYFAASTIGSSAGATLSGKMMHTLFALPSMPLNPNPFPAVYLWQANTIYCHRCPPS